MIIPKKIYFNASENRMRNIGDVISARNYFFTKKNKNLYHLLKNRFLWMNDFITNNDNIIELGSGPGLLKEFIKNKNFKTSDISTGDFLDFQNTDALNTNFEDESFSVIISSNLIHHIAYPIKLFNEVHRILKPGGIYIIQDVNFSLMLKLIILLMKSEGYDETVNVLNDNIPCNNVLDPWSGNNAIPNLIFDNFEQFNQKLNNKYELIYSQKKEFLNFLNSGGVISKTFHIPMNEFMNELLSKIDYYFTKIDKIFALQQSIVIKKI